MFASAGSRGGRKRTPLPIIGNGQSVGVSSPLLDLSQTWSSSSIFTGLKSNFTNTLASPNSRVLELQVNSAPKLAFGINDRSNLDNVFTIYGGDPAADVCTLRVNAGQVWEFGRTGGTTLAVSVGWIAGNPNAGAVGVQTTGALGFGTMSGNGGLITMLVNDATNIISQRVIGGPGSPAQTFRVYNTNDITSGNPTNYERGVFDWTTTANSLTIGPQAGGTGTLRGTIFVGTQWIFGGPTNNTVLGVVDANTVHYGDVAFRAQGMNEGLWVAHGVGIGTAYNTPDVFLYRIAAGVAAFTNASAANATGWMQWAGQSRVTSNFTSSTSTLTSITGISSVPLIAGRNYGFKAWLAVTGSSLAGVQIGITCSSTTITTLLSDGYMHDAGVMRGSSVGVINSTGTPVVAVSSATATSSNPSIRVDGMIRVASSGLFGLTLAQSTASGTQTIVSSGSWMLVYDMP